MTAPTFTLEEQTAMAERRFPQEWADAANLTGKRKSNRKRKLRDMAVYEAQMAALPEGARCGTCQHFDPKPPCVGIGSHCELDSDFYGYTLREPKEICPRWEERTHG